MHFPSLNEVANLIVKTKMYPYFDISNYVLMCCMVRDDYAIAGPSDDPVSFSRKHPLSSWFSSMLLCFASVILTNFLLGESPLAPFGNHRDLLTATATWYFINYCPFDIAYKLSKLFPILFAINVLKEVQRANKVYHGIQYAFKLYQQSYFIICVIGVLKGAGYYYMRLCERLARGTWIPSHHELLHPTGTTKICLLASILFILNQDDYIDVSPALLYLIIVAMFILVRVLYVAFHVKDPFVPVENILCTVLFGGIFEKLKRFVIKDSSSTENNAAKQTKNQKSD
ncbi:hypothetical protein HELRODRAFT_93147 [Helobdella robusta]|uniref:Uncharacterized protein n=1 Tax=Helobdella robusta TaxID=6412 RepID=T1G8U1_HELRO|nr:hypothetical protein HELRODRAFT_93147 [Helobdella robusta]ESO12047.1 hypothetical protein HELRODRAFT_93147 [Helobdella robusta]